jgi:hypothetical protein
MKLPLHPSPPGPISPDPSCERSLGRRYNARYGRRTSHSETPPTLSDPASVWPVEMRIRPHALRRSRPCWMVWALRRLT